MLASVVLRARKFVLGSMGVVALLCGWGPAANAQENDLFHAAYKGDVTRAKELLSSGADVNARNQQGNTALFLAAYQGFPEVVNLLLDNKAEIDGKCMGGATPLLAAAQEGHKEVVAILVARGAKVNAKSDQGALTPLIAALHAGHPDVAEVLLAHGADALAKSSEGDSALLSSAYRGYNDLVELTLAKKADVNGRNSYGQTPLMAAVLGGQTQTAEVLLAHGADVNGKDEDGATPLHLAKVMGQTPLVELLSKKGGVDLRPSFANKIKVKLDGAEVSFKELASFTVDEGDSLSNVVAQRDLSAPVYYAGAPSSSGEWKLLRINDSDSFAIIEVEIAGVHLSQVQCHEQSLKVATIQKKASAVFAVPAKMLPCTLELSKGQ
jgi:ankyrin repeat protein